MPRWGRSIPRRGKAASGTCVRIRTARCVGANRLVFPRYVAGSKETLKPIDKSLAFRNLAFNCFNYKLLGESAFHAIAGIVERAECYTFTFSRLDRAVEQLTALADPTPAREGVGA